MMPPAGAVLAAAAAALAACAAPPAPPPWTELFDGSSLAGWQVVEFGGEGEVAVEDRRIRMGPGSPLTGIVWRRAPPHGSYELEVVATRELGNDFFCGLTFPAGDDHLTLVLGGWGGTVCGLSNVDGLDAAHNETRRVRSFPLGRPVAVRIQVQPGRIEVAVDGAPLLAFEPTGRRLSLRPEMLPSRPLGIAAYATQAAIHAVRWRPL